MSISLSALSDSSFKATIVDFTATWCGPCKEIGPVFEEHSKDHTNVQFLKIDVDEQDEIAADQGVEAMPSFFVYQGGQKVDELVGASKNDLLALIKKFN